MSILPSILLPFLGVLGIFIIFCVCAWSLKRGVRSHHRRWGVFWKQEREANFTTKSHFPMPILLTIDRNKIPYVNNPTYQDAYCKLLNYTECKMVYLKDLSNVDIKMQYGINHFHEIIGYEETFYLFMDELIQYAALLREGNDISESIVALEYAYSFSYTSQKMTKQLLELQHMLLLLPLSIELKEELQKRIQIMLK